MTSDRWQDRVRKGTKLGSTVKRRSNYGTPQLWPKPPATEVEKGRSRMKKLSAAVTAPLQRQKSGLLPEGNTRDRARQLIKIASNLVIQRAVR